MKLVVGTYRKRTHIHDLLTSLDKHVKHVDEIIFVDDSGDLDNWAWLGQYGRVRPVATIPLAGYAPAMQTVCDVMEAEDDDYIAFWEEDFVATAPINLHSLADEIEAAPWLAQVVLMRQPWFPLEKRYGLLVHIATYYDTLLNPVRGVHCGLWEHTGIFSANPSVWQRGAWKDGWPQCPGSEVAKTKELVANAYKFALRDGQVVEHRGERSGQGY